MTRSSLCDYVNITSNRSNGRGGNRVCKVTPHYMCAKWSGRECADYFASTSRQASSNYCVGVDGDIAMSVDEDDRAWTSASGWNDRQAITVECGNLSDGSLTDATWEALVALCADVCARYGFRLEYTGDRDGTLTEHRMFASTDCPGEWLHARMGRLAEEVNARLDGGTAEAGGEEDNGGAGDGSLLAVDGYWGEKTTLALQEYFGCPWKDGVISGQWSGDAWRHEACTSFEHDYGGDGSPTVQRMQQRLGVTPDGLCGQDTINALIRRYQAASGATALDGKLDAGSITVKAMQRALNEGSF